MQKGVDYVGISVTYCCHDGNGNFVLDKRGQKSRDEQGTWEFGGGGLEFGDTVENTLKKEIKEEYCTDVLDYKFLGYRDIHKENNGQNVHWVTLDFKVLVDKEKVKNGEPHKLDAVEWFTLDNLPQPLHSQMTSYLKLYKDKIL